MTDLEWFLFFWFGMALIKWIIMIATSLVTLLNYEKEMPEAKQIIINVIVVVPLSCIVIGILWPVALYNERLGYFSFPDIRMQEIYLRFFERSNE
jgi:hypothetical protein